jgi:hypothetical protein
MAPSDRTERSGTGATVSIGSAVTVALRSRVTAWTYSTPTAGTPIPAARPLAASSTRSASRRCPSDRWTTTPTSWSAEATNEALLVDAANEPERLADLVGSGDQRPSCDTSSPPTGTGTTGRRSGRSWACSRRARSPIPSTRPSCRCRPTCWSSTATPCASARSSWRSCTCADTPPDPWRWSTATRRARTSSRAIPSSPAALEDRRATRVHLLAQRPGGAGVRPPAGRDVGLPGSRG